MTTTLPSAAARLSSVAPRLNGALSVLSANDLNFKHEQTTNHTVRA
jgi:hypothetical protein